MFSPGTGPGAKPYHHFGAYTDQFGIGLGCFWRIGELGRFGECFEMPENGQLLGNLLA